MSPKQWKSQKVFIIWISRFHPAVCTVCEHWKQLNSHLKSKWLKKQWNRKACVEVGVKCHVDTCSVCPPSLLCPSVLSPEQIVLLCQWKGGVMLKCRLSGLLPLGNRRKPLCQSGIVLFQVSLTAVWLLCCRWTRTSGNPCVVDKQLVNFDLTQTETRFS